MFVVFISANPIFSIPFMGIAYVWWLNAYFYEASRRAVVRMDILPHLGLWFNYQYFLVRVRILSLRQRVDKDFEKK